MITEVLFMKILALSGSPRENGNTDRYLEIVLAECRAQGAETELIRVCDLSVHGCRGCYGCVNAKACVHQDDFQLVFSKIMEADVLVLGSPVYHSSITPELKAVLDRTGFCGRWAVSEMKAKEGAYEFNASILSGKIVAPVTVARRAGQNFALAQLLLWAACNDCLIVNNTYWNVGVAGKGGAKDAAEDEEGVTTMKNLAKRIIYTANKLNA